jgi:hypothetical protein
MVKAIRGCIIECDQAVKSIILDLDSKLKFIIEDLDETHVFIDVSKLEEVQEKLENILEDNTYRVEGIFD